MKGIEGIFQTVVHRVYTLNLDVLKKANRKPKLHKDFVLSFDLK